MEPNEAQAPIADWWFHTRARVGGVLGGERSGKSWMTQYLASACINPFEPGEYWIVGPDYAQARAEFQYLYDVWSRASLIQVASMPSSRTQPWSMTSLGGTIVSTRSSSDPTRLSSFKINGWMLVEAGQQPFETYTRGLARISETRGFMLLSGTLEKSHSWYEDLYRRWQAPNILGAKFFSLPTWSNTDSYPGGRNDPQILELESEYPPDLFQERFGAVPTKISGVVIPEFDYQTHIKHLDPEQDVPVELWIDPGKHVYCVSFVQVIGLFTHVLDVVYVRGQIIEQVAPTVMANSLFKFVDKERAGVIDIAGKQEHADKSQITRWRELTGCHLRCKYVHERTGWETVRSRLRSANIHHEPLIYFNDHLSNAMTPDRRHALGPLAEFSLWRYPEISERQNEPGRPIDANNHFIKTLAYGLVDHFGVYMEARRYRKARKDPYWIPLD